jgi:hypothetical protein
MQKWLLIFNCQTLGLANCLRLYRPGLTIDSYDPSQVAANRATIVAQLDSYDRIIVEPQIRPRIDDMLPELAGVDVWAVPYVVFGGYQPDFCLLNANGKPSQKCHSALAYAAFQVGFDEAATVKLFHDRTYEALGYYERWDAEKVAITKRFTEFGFDIERLMVRWSRSGPFMYVPNHPKVACIADMARMLLTNAGLKPIDCGVLPHDNLANGPIFPVYPEIGARLGVKGSYWFNFGGYRMLDLEQFIAECFAEYRTASIELNKSFFPVVRKAIEYVRSRQAVTV